LYHPPFSLYPLRALRRVSSGYCNKRQLSRRLATGAVSRQPLHSYRTTPTPSHMPYKTLMAAVVAVTVSQQWDLVRCW